MIEEPLRLVHVSTVHPDTDTRIVEKQCKGLAALGHRVTLVIPSAVDSTRSGVQIKALRQRRGRFVRMTLSVAEAFRATRKASADIIHLHDPELLPMGLILRALGKPVVYDMHENLREQIKTKYWVPRWLMVPAAGAVAVLERISLNRMGVVMAEASYADHYPWVKRQTIVQNFPLSDQVTHHHVPKHHSPTVGYIGGVSEGRGALTVIRAIRQLREGDLDVNFDCVGEVSPDTAEDRDYLQASREGWLHAPGRLPPRDGWLRMARCHVGVATLKRLPNYVGSFPTKMFEYMAMGLPVVVSNFPLYREVVERQGCGICVDPDDVDGIADALRYLFDNPDRAREMGRNGRTTVASHYNWDTELTKLATFYRNEILNVS